MNNPTDEQRAKLPKWAREYITSLTRQRDDAIAIRNKMVDDQTPSPIYVEEWESAKTLKRYVQCGHNNVIIEHAGVKAEILLARKDDGQRMFGIEIKYSELGRRLCSETVALMPRGTGSIQLVHKDNL